MRRHEPSITINQVCIIKTQNGEENNVRDKKNRDKAKFETSTLKNLSIVSSVQPIPPSRRVLREGGRRPSLATEISRIVSSPTYCPWLLASLPITALVELVGPNERNINGVNGREYSVVKRVCIEEGKSSNLRNVDN